MARWPLRVRFVFMVRRGRASTRSLATSRTAGRWLALGALEARCAGSRELRRTGCVSELVLLPFYPVLEGLGIAPRDLDFLLDRFLIHVGHALVMLPDAGGGSREGARRRGRRSRGRGRTRQPGHRRRGGEQRREAWRRQRGRAEQMQLRAQSERQRTADRGGLVMGASQRSAGDERYESGPGVSLLG